MFVHVYVIYIHNIRIDELPTYVLGTEVPNHHKTKPLGKRDVAGGLGRMERLVPCRRGKDGDG